MSSSPTPSHDSHPSSRPPSPPNTASVRSQAVAKLKRAASLPRRADGGRPSQQEEFHHQPEAGPFGLSVRAVHYDAEEFLSPSPVARTFDHTNLYAPSSGMQRSGSSSSSYHIPTPPQMTYQQSVGTTHQTAMGTGQATLDWPAMQLAQSYLPTRSPAGLPAGLPPAPFHSNPASGRNTPSPLPTLGEIRSLQRSNSDAARARAMSKLTGGARKTATDDNYSLVQPGGRPILQRADTGGAIRLLGGTKAHATDNAPIESRPNGSPERRPRLQRSFTVSSTDMGEERRSAVGRRMLERLAERRVARQKEEVEMRTLWQKRRSAAGSGSARSDQDEEHHPHPSIPVVQRTSPIDSPVDDPRLFDRSNMLSPDDRPVSRGTVTSGDEAFEYEAHLRRSLSSRTARGAVADVVVANQVSMSLEAPIFEQLNDVRVHHSQPATNIAQVIPHSALTTPARHQAHSSTSTQATFLDSHSPHGSTISRDALGSMTFILGGSGTPNGGRLGAGSWPQEVEDNSNSEWGTPARDIHQATFTDSPLGRSPLASHSNRIPPQLHPQTEEQEDELTPPGVSERSSIMSWEEVGGPGDLEVPIDQQYIKKSGSISAKMGRGLRTAMRKRSASRSSVTSSSNISPPNSPQHKTKDALFVAAPSFSRRGSEASTAASQASAARSIVRGSPLILQPEPIRHQPSLGSLSPSLSLPFDMTQSSLFLQQQLAADPAGKNWLPVAEANDPRIQNSKLSPFPGIAHLEGRRKLSEAGVSLTAPNLIHQASDSVVPSQQRVTPAGNGGDSIYSLPLPVVSPPEMKRASDDSVSKRSWLAKAFGSQTSPRSSGSISRKPSIPDLLSGDGRHNARIPSIDYYSSLTASAETDPFAAPPPPVIKPNRHLSASPAISMVPEVSEEGSRLTRFTVATHRVASPLGEEPEQQLLNMPLPQKSLDVLNRMDDLLALGPDDPARPDILDDPPRKLLAATQVLQVVNAHTAKDRFLLLFNDILLITKPVMTESPIANLATKFAVKSVVSLDQLHLSGLEDEATTEPERHVVVTRFIEQFARDPVAACKYLVERSSPRVDDATLASLIFKTAELNKVQIGNLLATQGRLLRGFIDRFNFVGVRIDEALSMFLLSVRLPEDPTAREALLRGFAVLYTEANRSIVSFHQDLAADLVLAIMQLNDALYDLYGFALRNEALTQEVFISAFHSKDPQGLVHDDLLAQIYEAISVNPLQQSLITEEEERLARRVTVTPARLPNKLTYNTWSDSISISISVVDPRFKIRLLGEGLQFDPSELDFGKSSEQTFRVRGTSLGTKAVLFDRFGTNSPLYAQLGNARIFTVERAFMRHTFHVAFVSHTGLKRKYCCSVPDAATRQKWGTLLKRQIAATQAIHSSRAYIIPDRLRRAADGVSLQVLRDAVLCSEDNDTMAESRQPVPPRSGSVSAAYSVLHAHKEDDLGPLHPSKGGTGDRQSGLMPVQTGKELVLLCRQNSLLPRLLVLLQAGVQDGQDTSLAGSEVRTEALARDNKARMFGARV